MAICLRFLDMNRTLAATFPPLQRELKCRGPASQCGSLSSPHYTAPARRLSPRRPTVAAFPSPTVQTTQFVWQAWQDRPLASEKAALEVLWDQRRVNPASS